MARNKNVALPADYQLSPSQKRRIRRMCPPMTEKQGKRLIASSIPELSPCGKSEKKGVYELTVEEINSSPAAKKAEKRVRRLAAALAAAKPDGDTMLP